MPANAPLLNAKNEFDSRFDVVLAPLLFKFFFSDGSFRCSPQNTRKKNYQKYPYYCKKGTDVNPRRIIVHKTP
jgi:hypothetical protein